MTVVIGPGRGSTEAYDERASLCGRSGIVGVLVLSHGRDSTVISIHTQMAPDRPDVDHAVPKN